MKFPILAALATGFLVLSACSSGEKATGFITENVPAPASAKTARGDVPRDSYGRPFQYEMLGKQVPDFELTRLDGTVVTDEDLMGQWTVVDIWGLWCPDCITDAPNVKKLAADVSADPSLSFLSIHSPPNAARADEAFGKYPSLEAYFEAIDGGYPVAVDSDASVKDKFNLPWVPMHLLVDPSGTIRGFRTEFSAAGEKPVETFLADVKAVMAAG